MRLSEEEQELLKAALDEMLKELENPKEEQDSVHVLRSSKRRIITIEQEKELSN